MRRLPLPVLLVLGLVLAGPAWGASSACDATGDRRSMDDCLRHAHVGAAADGRVMHGEAIALRPRLHRALRGEATTLVVQARRLGPRGVRGPWLDVRRVRWPANAAPGRAIRVCAADLAGRYQFRVVAPDRSTRQGVVTGAVTSSPVGVTLPRGSTPGACPNSPDDESNIEWFNLENFDDEFVITATSTANATTLSLQCPTEPSALGLTLAVGVFLAGQDVGAGCNAGSISLDAATLAAGGYPSCEARGSNYVCDFEIHGWNSQTGAIYTSTIWSLVLPVPGTSGPYLPELQPATLPICNSTFQPCLLTGTCNLTPSIAPIRLCDSPTSCELPPPSSTSGYTDTTYFQTVITQVTPPA